MLPDPTEKVGRNADIERAATFIGENVDARLLHFSCFLGFSPSFRRKPESILTFRPLARGSFFPPCAAFPRHSPSGTLADGRGKMDSGFRRNDETGHLGSGAMRQNWTGRGVVCRRSEERAKLTTPRMELRGGRLLHLRFHVLCELGEDLVRLVLDDGEAERAEFAEYVDARVDAHLRLVLGDGLERHLVFLL